MIRWMLAALVIAVAQASPTSAQVDLKVVAARARVRYVDVPRQVLAFYYPWYSAETWKDVDVTKHTISNVAHFPLAGPYESHYPKLIARHCAWARQAGIDGWIVSWWGHGTPTDRALTPILDAARLSGLKVTIYYETVPAPRTGRSAADDLLTVLRHYAKHPAWLTVGGKPVVFVYGRALGEIGLPGWLAAIDLVNHEYPGGAVFLGDDPSRAAARVFDGIHTYNTAGSLTSKSEPQVRQWARQTYSGWLRAADSLGRVSAITVIPGYDDTKIHKLGLRVDRLAGALYRSQWEEAIRADPHWILVTSWNEWFEGSEIEPSIEFGERYLNATAEFATRFKSSVRPLRVPAAPPQPLADLAGLRCGVLPDADSSAVWELARLPSAPRILSWQEVANLQPATLKELPLLVYAANENYRRTINSPGDVDAGILRFLHAGGLLVALPSGPMPFHYDERGQAVAGSQKFGLPLSVAGSDGGWERPSEGVKLRFVQVGKHLGHVPAGFPFPETDPRWRPLVRSRLSPGDVVIPLIELRDDRNTYYGDAATYVEHRVSEPKNGRVLYVWFGLLDTHFGEALVDDVLRFVAKKSQPAGL